MKKSIVIIEDEKEIANTLAQIFEKKNFHVLAFYSAEDFFSSPTRPDHGVYLVDWNLPGIKGVDIIRSIRLRDKISPLFIISATNYTEQVIEGLRAGADDYLIKPLDCDELLIRVENAYQRASYIYENLINIGLRPIPEANIVMKDGVSIGLTSKEFLIFQELYRQHNKPINRQTLLGLFSNDLEMTSRAVDVHIFSLRKKMKKFDIRIESVRGVGYRMLL